MLGVDDNVQIAAATPASTTSNPDDTSGSWFDTLGWQKTAQNVLLGLVAGKVNKQYGLNISNNLPYQKTPNGGVEQAGGEMAYAAVNSGAAGTALQAAGWLQRNGIWVLAGVGGLIVAYMLTRR